MIVCRSKTLLPEHPSLLINGVLITAVDHLELLGVTLHSRLTFKQQLRNIKLELQLRNKTLELQLRNITLELQLWNMTI